MSHVGENHMYIYINIDWLIDGARKIKTKHEFEKFQQTKKGNRN